MYLHIASRRSRNYRVAALAESAAALMIITSLVVGGVLLVANVGIACFYKQKLIFVSIQTAQYAASLSSSVDDASMASLTRAYADSLLPKVGLPSTSQFTCTRDPDFAYVHLGLGGLKLLGSATGVLPTMISLNDDEAAARQTTLEPMAWLWIDGLDPNDPNNASYPGNDQYSGQGVIPIYRQQPATSINGYSPTRPYTFKTTYIMKFTAPGGQPLYPGYSKNAANGTQLNTTATPDYYISHP
jgi:hypothetical protein